MASMKKGKTHLAQTDLSGVQPIIEELESWLAGANFTMAPTGDIGKCTEGEEDQRAKLGALFQALDISSQIDDKTISYAILRFPGPQTSRVHAGDGHWADIVPIRIIDGRPSASEKDLVIGNMIHITGRVEIKPALDCLILTPGSKSRSRSGSKSSGSKSSGSKSSGSKSSGSK